MIIILATITKTPIPFDWTGVATIGAVVAAIAAAISAGASWKAVREQARLERPLLVAGFSASADGTSSTVSITNVGRRTATYVSILVATHDTYRWGQMQKVIQPNETIESTSSSLHINLDDTPLAKVVVSCVDSMDNVQVAWSMDGKVNFKARSRSQWLDGVDGMTNIFEMLYPNEKLRDKTLVGSN
jgi:F0F1-type ATP synthase membrane subunit c/vacuolar-type H+-ATPase subunit K